MGEGDAKPSIESTSFDVPGNRAAPDTRTATSYAVISIVAAEPRFAACARRCCLWL